MRKTLKRAAASIAAVGAIGAGTIVAMPEAHAATPGDLQMVGGVNCEFKKWGPNWNSGPIWQMHRHMGVKNIGGSTMTHVKVTELFGATKQVPAMKKADLTKAGVKNARDTKAGELLPGQTFTAFTSTWQGCWPSSISGYAIGDQVENIFNNAGFWWNLRQIEPKAPKQTQPTTSASGALVASKAEVLTAVAESPVR